ncbi:general stress protein [Paenibacillus beijingensis]|uniref:General stress protein n=1 Tax=Paenibacillus beijingensis TaxID=1126833 RepID=A0A0D5NF65_9BACL|nr:general stress protein [Paenibacillus beijingensis]AJY73886.1 general stress protein [Paenibacillus beijingensis]
MKPSIQVVENGMDAMSAVRELNRRGYNRDEIYVLTHDKDETDRLADNSNANEIGLSEEGVFNSMANMFRSRGDELRSKLGAIGLNDMEAERYEEVLDQGKILVIAKVH